MKFNLIEPVSSYPEIELTAHTKLVGQKLKIGDKNYFSLRIFEIFHMGTGYLPTRKGICIEEKKWQEKIVPFLNQIFLPEKTSDVEDDKIW